jgi:hypothetical protein
MHNGSMAQIGVTSVSEGKKKRSKGEKKKRVLGGNFTRRKEGTTSIIH